MALNEVRQMAGGCQCGSVRYRAAIRSDEAYLCHCAMCRRATGGVAAAFVNVALGDMAWDTEPAWYRSSPIAERPFCRTCGTPLGFRFLEGATNMDVTVGSFDEPGCFRPTSNFSCETILPHWQDTGHLPGRRMADNPSTTDRWMKAVGKLPD